MEELPVATVRPRHFLGRIAWARGAFARWMKAKLRKAIEGRHAPLLLTAIFFSGMMLAMGYVADRAQDAAEGIDEAHRAAFEAAARERRELPPAPPAAFDADEQERLEAGERAPAAALFYIRPATGE